MWGIPSGQKKDLRFIKDLCMVAFGPETLAKCSIYGTAKGRKKAGDSEHEKKDPLNPTILEAVKGKPLLSLPLITFLSICFIIVLICVFLSAKFYERVAKEEGITVEEAIKHPRCENSRINGAVRDHSKRARTLGFGNGTLPDSADEFFAKNNGQS